MAKELNSNIIKNIFIFIREWLNWAAKSNKIIRVLRNKLKDFYCKYFLYDFPIKWKKEYIEIHFMDQVIKMNYYQDNTLGFYDSKYAGDMACFSKKQGDYFRYYKIKQGDIIVDGGAYEGAFAILASKLVGNNGKVIAFEPDGKAFKRLKEDIELNNVKNVIPIKKGLWNREGIVRFREEVGASRILKKGESKINVTSLNKELKRLNIKKVDFIKFDIEGAEIEAIEGCKEILKKNNVNLAIASYHEVDGEKTYINIEKQLKDLGYIVKTEFPRHLTTYAQKKKREND